LGKVVLAVPGGRGGMSGPACKSIGRAQLVLWKASLAAVGRADFPIVSSLGVDGAEEVNARLRLGAAAAGGTSMFMLSMHWAETVRRVVDNLERIGYARGPDLNASPATAASTLLIDPLIVP
jgi:dihydroorotate dehydrogenase